MRIENFVIGILNDCFFPVFAPDDEVRFVPEINQFFIQAVFNEDLNGIFIMIWDIVDSSLYGVEIAGSLVIDNELGDFKIKADEAVLKQILSNLLSNAVKFTPQGGGIDLRAWKEGKNVVVKISDTGIGIEAEDQERIFNAFEQVDSSYSRKHGGTGLGLDLTRKLVEMHGGRIWVESEGEGNGSAFSFTIPILDSESCDES